MFCVKDVYGFIIVEKNEVIIGFFCGKRIEVIDEFIFNVFGKICVGG